MRLLFLTITLILFFSASAQRQLRGSVEHKPWVEDRRRDYLLTYPGMKDADNKADHKEERIEYGKWRFDLAITRRQHDLNEDEKFNLRTVLFGSSGKRSGRIHGQIEVKGTDPRKQSFFASLDYETIVVEDYDTKGLLAGEEVTRAQVVHKKLKGYIVDSRSDSSIFHIELYFDSSAQSAHHILFETADDAIKLVAVFKPATGKHGVGDVFSGIEFQKQGKTIAAAHLGKDLVNDVVYRYWISDELDDYSKQAVAMLLTLVVRFI